MTMISGILDYFFFQSMHQKTFKNNVPVLGVCWDTSGWDVLFQCYSDALIWRINFTKHLRYIGHSNTLTNNQKYG